ncbi:MAG: TorF family putative porin [bacterium]
MKKIIFVFVVSVLMFSQIASAGISYNGTFVSQYIWRGFDLNANQPAFQPGLSMPIGDSDFSFDIWGNVNLGQTSAKEFTELDYILTYAKSFNGIDYSAGYTYYTFPNLTGAAAKSGEYFAGVGFPDQEFSPAITLYYDHDQGDGLYASLSGSYDIASLTVGYSGGQWGAASGISDITLGLGTEFEYQDLSLSPFLTYTYIPESSGVNTSTSELAFGYTIGGQI